MGAPEKLFGLDDKNFAGINQRENKSLSALQRLGNRDLRAKLKREGKDRRATWVEAREDAPG
jgi:hypothetical protein